MRAATTRDIAWAGLETLLRNARLLLVSHGRTGGHNVSALAAFWPPAPRYRGRQPVHVPAWLPAVLRDQEASTPAQSRLYRTRIVPNGQPFNYGGASPAQTYGCRRTDVVQYKSASGPSTVGVTDNDIRTHCMPGLRAQDHCSRCSACRNSAASRAAEQRRPQTSRCAPTAAHEEDARGHAVRGSGCAENDHPQDPGSEGTPSCPNIPGRIRCRPGCEGRLLRCVDI